MPSPSPSLFPSFNSSVTSSVTPSRPVDPVPARPTTPEGWWRHLCWLEDHRIALVGDLPHDRVRAAAQLDEWVAAGVTHIVDLRGEHSDEAFVAERAPGITYCWLGTHDDGTAQDADWFTTGVTAILEALSHPGARVVVHCHMGVNRAPSMGFAALLALGLDPVRALDTIRSARPIAAVLYAEDAVRWWTEIRTPTETATALRAVRDWHRANPCDVRWIISRIRRAEWDD